jgi:hypothetical protein
MPAVVDLALQMLRCVEVLLAFIIPAVLVLLPVRVQMLGHRLRLTW